MSFYTDVKAELIALPVEDVALWRAELVGTAYAIGSLRVSEGHPTLVLRSERAGVLRRALSGFKAAYPGVQTQMFIVQKQRLHKHNSYQLRLDGEPVQSLIRSLDWLTGFDARHLGVESVAARRALMRGSFLGTGWLSDPTKGYHLEFALSSPAYAEALCALLAREGLCAKRQRRKEVEVVYLKGAEDIAVALGMMGSVSAMLRFENVRAYKQVLGDVNRAMNCESANLSKTLNAAFEQLRAIEYIRDAQGLDKLPMPLRIVAEARLHNPSATLAELTELLAPLGRSGVNHRLRRIQEYAQELRLREGALE